MSIGSISGIVTIAFGVIYSLLAFNMERASIGNPMEPLLFPMILGVLLTICGIGLFIMEVRKQEKKKVEKKGKGFSITQDSKLIIYTCGVSLVYALIFEKVGYVFSTIFFMFAMLFALNDGASKWKTNIAVATGFSIGVYIVFMKLLGIPLPMIPFLEI